MAQTFTDQELRDAMEHCASEPVHIPGVIQPFGYLFAYDVGTGLIGYMSENCSTITGRDLRDAFGTSVSDLFGHEIWHELQNIRAHSGFGPNRSQAPTVEMSGSRYHLSAFQSGDMIVVELENADEVTPLSVDILRDMAFLTGQIQSYNDEQELCEKSVVWLRRLTGYDRVLAYRFDASFNGDVIAESTVAGEEPLLGLRFPHWDIPAQARDIMRQIPLRLVNDVDQKPVAILAADSSLPALDITPAHLRGVSPIHMQYLRNMGTAATMTLSIVVDGALWGMFSFHSARPSLPSSQTRQLLTGLLPMLTGRLQAVQLSHQLMLAEELELLKTDLPPNDDSDDAADRSLEVFAPKLLAAFKADGVAILAGSHVSQFGVVPSANLLNAIAEDARDTGEKFTALDTLSDRFPDLMHEANGVAGCLTAPFLEDRAVCIFRKALDQGILWAGAPEKKLEDVSGQFRLQPRGSFAVYLETVKGRSAPWEATERAFVAKLWGLLISIDRQSLIRSINRQQVLMIDELNHRVRNILSLVRSVSRQARSHYGSLESYSAAIEARILALAAAHEIGLGASVAAISMRRIIAIEASPYEDEVHNRVLVHGADPAISAETGPIFALTIHELMTNSAKYGALSCEAGRVDISIAQTQAGVALDWKESGGPPVTPPKDDGFGTTLISKAVPYELGGHCDIWFEPDGVRVSMLLPSDILDVPSELPEFVQGPETSDALVSTKLPEELMATRVLVVEDNFMVATEMSYLLEDIGFSNVETAPNAAEAAKKMTKHAPKLAILDINLGHGSTSAELASTLTDQGVAIVFVTGYRERARLSNDLAQWPVVLKPVTNHELLAAILRVL